MSSLENWVRSCGFHFKPVLRAPDFPFMVKSHSFTVVFGSWFYKHISKTVILCKQEAQSCAVQSSAPLHAGLQPSFVSQQHTSETYFCWRFLTSTSHMGSLRMLDVHPMRRANPTSFIFPPFPCKTSFSQITCRMDNMPYFFKFYTLKEKIN